MLTYATVPQLAEHVSAADLDKVGDDAPRYIERASRMVRRATRNDCYDTTPAGLPSDPVLADALKVATCVQVLEWIRNDVDPLAGAASVKPAVASASTNGSSVAYDVSAQTAARARLLTSLSDDAFDTLRNAGLASARVFRT